nr:hypothetical protein [Tanacetum cinerariifolium]
MTSLEDINDPTEAMNAALILFAKEFQLTAPTNNNQRTSSNPRNRQIAQPVMNMGQDRQIQNVEGSDGNQFGQYAGQVEQNQQGGLGRIARNCTARQRRRDDAYLQTQLFIAQKEEAWIQIQVEEFNFMAAACDLDEIEEVNANCILMANLQHASTSGTQLDKAPVYDTDGSAWVQLNDKCYNNKIFNIFTQEEQYTDLLELIPKPQLVPQNDNHVTSVALSMVQSGGTLETSFAPNEETRAHQETVYRNLVDQVAQKMALGYPNPSYLKKAQLKQQSLYNANLLLEEDDPPVMYDSEETLELAQESHEKMRFLKKEIIPANYAKINHLSRVFVPQTTKSKEELFLSNVSNMVTVSKMISIPNEDLLDDTTPSVARKFLNKVKSFLVTLQHVVKQKITLEVRNWSSSAHKEVRRIISHEISLIINQVDARVQNFEIQFLQEAAKFVRDFKSLATEADESLDKQKSLELKIERLLKASVSHDIMSIVQNGFVDNNWYTKCEECKYDKTSYDKAYNDMQQKVKRLQAQLRDLKGKSSDTPSASNTLDPLNQKGKSSDTPSASNALDCLDLALSGHPLDANRRDLPKDTHIDRLEVLMYDTGKRSKVGMRIMLTETELTLEQTQQGHQSDIFMIFTVTMEILLEPTSNKLLVGQMETGEENSNPFMAGSLAKTILLTFILGICINMVILNSHLSIESLLVRKVAASVDVEDVDDVPAADAEPTPPSPTPTTTPPPPQELPSTLQLAPSPPPSIIAQPSSPPQQQQPS